MLFFPPRIDSSEAPTEFKDIQGTETFLLQFHSDLPAQRQRSYRFARWQKEKSFLPSKYLEFKAE